MVRVSSRLSHKVTPLGGSICTGFTLTLVQGSQMCRGAYGVLILYLPPEILSGAYFCGRVVFVAMKYLELRNTL